MTTFHDMLEEIKCAKINADKQLEFCSVNLENSEEGIILLLFFSLLCLVPPKWFWSDQIDLDLTIMIWSRPR